MFNPNPTTLPATLLNTCDASLATWYAVQNYFGTVIHVVRADSDDQALATFPQNENRWLIALAQLPGDLSDSLTIANDDLSYEILRAISQGESMRDMCHNLGYASRAASDRLDWLRRFGYWSYNPQAANGCELTDKATALPMCATYVTYADPIGY
jgi:hypothetical protein